MDAEQNRRLPNVRPMGTSDILDMAMHLYRDYFAPLVVTTGSVAVPVNLLAITGARLLGADAFLYGPDTGDGPSRAPEVGAVLGSVAFYGIMGVISSLAYVLQYAALTECSAQAYFGQRCTVRAAYGAAVRAFGPLLGTWVLAAVVTSAVAIAVLFAAFAAAGVAAQAAQGSDAVMAATAITVGLALGALVLAAIVAITAFLPQIVVLERVAYVDAFKRHWMLLRGGTLQSLGGIIVVWVLTGLFQMAFAVSVSALITEVILPAFGTGWEVESVATNVVGSVAALFVQPFLVVAMTVFYYDRRLRNEALDMLWAIERLPATVPRGAA